MIIDKEFIYQKFPKTKRDLELLDWFKERIAEAEVASLQLNDAKTALELVDTLLPIGEDIELEQGNLPRLSRFGLMALHVDEKYQQCVFIPLCKTFSSAIDADIPLNEAQVRRLRATFIEFALLANVHAQQVIDKLNNTYGCDDDLTLKLVERRCPNLNRFLNAQEGNGRGVNDGDIISSYQQALKEVKAGAKTSHWIWYVFPQMAGIKGTHSKPALFYGINGRLEAYQYINHPILRARLIEIVEAVTNNQRTIYEIFGNDAMKVRACVLLFASVCDIPAFKQLKNKYRW